MTPTANSESLKLAKDIGLEWFKIHADQRLRLVNFFVIIVGFSIGGYFTALSSPADKPAAITIASFLILICFCFQKIDARTSQLVKIGENALSLPLKDLENALGSDAINVVKHADNKGENYSYLTIFRILFWTIGLMSAVGVLSPAVFVR